MRWEQTEIWERKGEKWEMTSSWREFDVATAVARSKNAPMRLVHSVYDDARRVSEDVLAELGATREHP
jgi:hypothetical protein